MNAPRDIDLQVARRLRGVEPSEFGRGFIQQLLYFVEHFGRADVQEIYSLHRHQQGEISLEVLERSCPGVVTTLQVYKDIGEALSSKISLFLNGASDHLYDLVIPESLPKDIQEKAKELRELAVDLGHGRGLMDKSVCTMENFQKIQRLSFDVARMVDILVFDVDVDEGENQ